MCDTKSVLTTGLIAGLALTGVGAVGIGAAGLSSTVLGGTMSAGTAALAGGVLTMGAMQAYGQNEQAIAQQKMYERQAQIGDFQAKDAEARGAAAEEQHREQVRKLTGEQRAAMGAAGGVLGMGTNEALLEQTQTMGEMDAVTIRANALREAWGYKVGADTTRYQGELARTKGRYDAMGTMLTSGLQAFGTYKKG